MREAPTATRTPLSDTESAPLDAQSPSELTFRVSRGHLSWWEWLISSSIIGAVVGAAGWLLRIHDGDWRTLLYCVGGCVILMNIALPWITRRSVHTVRVTDDGFTLFRDSGSRSYAWRDLQAARFQETPGWAGGSATPCFAFRLSHKSVEFEIDFDPSTRAEFQAVVERLLRERGIPDTHEKLLSFESFLSLCGAWTFAVGAISLVIAHLLVYHTLGTLFGGAIMFTGCGIALMTRAQRVSRVVIAATVLFIAGTATIVYAADLSPRGVLLWWEQRERELGHAPWQPYETEKQKNASAVETRRLASEPD